MKQRKKFETRRKAEYQLLTRVRVEVALEEGGRSRDSGSTSSNSCSFLLIWDILSFQTLLGGRPRA